MVPRDKERIIGQENNYEQQLINWYFTLNAGGLVATLTLLTVQGDPYRKICFWLLLLFSSGLISIILACKFEKSRLRSITDKKVAMCTPSELLINNLQWMSIMFFFIGLGIGFYKLGN